LHVAPKRKASTAALYRDILYRLVLPELGKRKAEKITTSELARLHLVMQEHPYQANRMLAIVGSLYSFAEKRKIIPLGTNPVRGIEKYTERGRERFLSVLELTRLGEAIRGGETIGIPYLVDETNPKAKHAAKHENRRTIIGPHAAAALRLLIFTGARLREILGLRWEWVDLERRAPAPPRQQDRQEGDRAQRPGHEDTGRLAPAWHLCHVGAVRRNGRRSPTG